MRTVSKAQVIECLKSLNISQGDGLLVHSAVQYLGQPKGGVGMYFEAIQKAIGAEGTLVVPTFNFDFAEVKRYDPQKTPSKGMGVFSEFVRQHPDALRSLHPMQSLAAIGPYANDLVSRDTPSAFEPGSAFDRLLDLDFKLLLLGADVSAVSIFHISEYRHEVPYRYWKDFTGQVRTSNGLEKRTYRMFVRDLEINPRLTAGPVQALLQQRGQWASIELNYGYIVACQLVDFVAAVDHFLSRDPWSLVTNPPQ